jgi:hypothetical protein
LVARVTLITITVMVIVTVKLKEMEIGEMLNQQKGKMMMTINREYNIFI